MPDLQNLTGHWVGSYRQYDRSSPISAELTQDGETLSGMMQDGEPDHDRSVFQAASEAGLPPGADEQIVERLRAMFPDAPAAPIRFVSHLPPQSALQGRVEGLNVYFLKTYRGTHTSGYLVGNAIVGSQIDDHSVHYKGRVSPDGLEIEGQWWIDSVAERRLPGGEGSFILRRVSGA
jgi:hypothetical protein